MKESTHNYMFHKGKITEGELQIKRQSNKRSVTLENENDKKKKCNKFAQIRIKERHTVGSKMSRQSARIFTDDELTRFTM